MWFVGQFAGQSNARAADSIWAAFAHALPLDFSTMGYAMLLPVLLFCVGFLFSDKFRPVFQKVIYYFNLVLMGVAIPLSGANVVLYKEWQTPLNSRAFEYLQKNPIIVFNSISWGYMIFYALLYLSVCWGAIRLYRWWVGREQPPKGTSRWWATTFFLWFPLLVVAIRGGFGIMPINESAVYYSVEALHNHAAVNPLWNLTHSLVERRANSNHYQVMEDAEAQQITQNLLQTTEKQILPLADSTGKPYNVVILMLESMTAQVIEELGGKAGVCPNFSQLCREGILFSECYGSGYRTDQGYVAVLGGYPAQPDQSIILLDDKAVKLSSLSKVLVQKGYSTLFCTGGETTFANTGMWLRNQQMQRLISMEDFTRAQRTQRWGADDKQILQRALTEIGVLPQPFLATVMTISLHPPYDVPYKGKFWGSSEPEQFLNTAAFVDEALGAFFDAARQQAWYNNTIFVLVADHGSSQPIQAGMDNPKSRHIPLLFYGAPIAADWKGKTMRVFANHHDVPATVLPLLGVDAGAAFPWSRNLWTQREGQGFAYYTNENGVGWVNEKGGGFYFFDLKQWHYFRGAGDSADQRNARGYLQAVYEDFLKK